MKKVTFEELMPLITEAFERGQTITIPVTGRSMTPTLSPGDAVTLQSLHGETIVRGDILLYRRANGQYVLHRVVAVHAATVDFCGDAQVSIESGVPKRDVIARVISCNQNGDDVSLQKLRQQGRRRLRTRLMRRLALSRHYAQVNADDSNMHSALRFVGGYIRRRIWAIVALCFISCLSALSMLGMALASGRVIDKALMGEMHNFREWFVLLFVLLFVVAVSNILYSNIRVRVSGKIKNDMRRNIFSLLLVKEYSSVKDLHSGEILNRLTSDLQFVVDGAVTLIPQMFSIGTKLVGGLAFMLFVEPIFTSIVLGGGILFAVGLQFFSRYYKRMHKACQETEGKTRSYLQECIENLMVIKSFTNEAGVLKVFDTYQQDNYRQQLRRNVANNISNTAVYVGFTVAYYAGLAWGVLRIAGVFGAAMSVGTFTTLLQIMEQIRTPFRSASGLLPQIYAMVASAERLYELLELPDEKHSLLPEASSDLYDQMISLRLDGVSYAYEDGKYIFETASAVFLKNHLTAVMGASGTGKSTLIKLLLGLIHPQSGAVTLTTDRDVIELDAATRSLFAFVPQGNMILSGTIADNILFGNECVSEESLHRAIELACLKETVTALPGGLDTVVGERGIGLSEGQIQRVAIARAILSQAPILLLDECTSALDSATEVRLLNNLRSLTDRTIIFISHRPAVLKQADTVLVVRDHRIFNETKETTEHEST